MATPIPDIDGMIMANNEGEGEGLLPNLGHMREDMDLNDQNLVWQNADDADDADEAPEVTFGAMHLLEQEPLVPENLDELAAMDRVWQDDDELNKIQGITLAMMADDYVDHMNQMAFRQQTLMPTNWDPVGTTVKEIELRGVADINLFGEAILQDVHWSFEEPALP